MKKITALLTAFCTAFSLMLPVSAAVAPEYRIPAYKYAVRTDENGAEYAAILSCPSSDPYLFANLAIPEKLGGYPVREIESLAFYALYVDSVYLPESVERIAQNAFLDSYARVYEVANPECEIGAYAFGYYSVPADMEDSEPVYRADSTIVLFGEEGSSAQAYAEENAMFFGTGDRCFPYCPVILDGGEDHAELLTACWRPSLKMRPAVLVLPTELGGMPVTHARAKAFTAIDRSFDYDLYTVYGITVPASYRVIEDRTFDLCNSYNVRCITVLNREIRFLGAKAVNAESKHTVYGFAGSTTETYCAENGLHFVPLGDVDASGEIRLADAVLMQRWLLGFRDTVLPDWRAADLNGDGVLTAQDLTLMRGEMIAVSSMNP